MASFVFESKRYPDEPGCYLMKDTRGRVIYVGKAKRLRRRLASYFHTNDLHPRTRRLVSQIADIEVILVNTESESLALENNLIKRYRPRYNRQLMAEDSGYHYIVLTDETWPRLVPFRKRRYNKALGETRVARRFGPYPSRRYRDTLLAYVADAVGVRTCETLPSRPCLRYHLGRCSGVCIGEATGPDYADRVSRTVTFLVQPHDALVAAMRREVDASAERLEFERAQWIKLQVEALAMTLQAQVVERDVDHDQDVLYCGDAGMLVMRVRQGAVIGMKLHRAPASADGPLDLAGLLKALYSEQCPDELIVNRQASESIVASLGQGNGRGSNGGPPRIGVPPAGSPEAALLALCERNYRYRTGEEH